LSNDTKYYEPGLMGVGQALLYLDQAFSGDPVVSGAFRLRLDKMGMAMLESSKAAIIRTVDGQKSKVDMEKLKLVDKGIVDIMAGHKDAFYHEHKSYLQQA